MFGLGRDDSNLTRTDYVKKWELAMKEAYALAMKNSSTSAADGKRQYDRKVRFSISISSLGTGYWYGSCLSVVDQGSFGLFGSKRYIL